MTDKFADLEEPKNRTLPAALAVLLIFTGLFAYRVSQNKPIEISGVVVAAPRDGIAQIRLDDGMTIKASVASGQAPEVGQRVEVLETVALLSAPTYQLGKKASSP
jgi:hypothetical protein